MQVLCFQFRFTKEPFQISHFQYIPVDYVSTGMGNQRAYWEVLGAVVL